MATFPPLESRPARDCEPGDVIYGRQGMFDGTFMTFKYPVTVTEVTDVKLFGENANGSGYSQNFIGKSDVLVEPKGK